MNIGKLTAIAALALGLGAAMPATAAWNDETGLTSLGIDISRAGSSPAAVQQFVAGLAPETQRGILSGCQTAVSQPEGYAPNVVAFCANALGAGGSPPVLGFMQDEPAPMTAPLPDAAY